MVGYLPLAVAAGGLLDERAGRLPAALRWYITVCLAITVAGTAVAYAYARDPSLRRFLPAGSYDPDRDFFNEMMRLARGPRRRREEAATLGPDAVVASCQYALCAHLLTALDDQPAVYCPGRRTDRVRLPRASRPTRGARRCCTSRTTTTTRTRRRCCPDRDCRPLRTLRRRARGGGDAAVPALDLCAGARVSVTSLSPRGAAPARAGPGRSLAAPLPRPGARGRRSAHRRLAGARHPAPARDRLREPAPGDEAQRGGAAPCLGPDLEPVHHLRGAGGAGPRGSAPRCRRAGLPAPGARTAVGGKRGERRAGRAGLPSASHRPVHRPGRRSSGSATTSRPATPTRSARRPGLQLGLEDEERRRRHPSRRTRSSRAWE